jgi:hypothetical protein
MDNIKRLIMISAVTGLLSAAPIASASAGSFTQPGENLGLAMGAPLPEGVFFVNNLNYGNNRGAGYGSGLGVDIPAIAWSTPWTLAGARIEVIGTPPVIWAGNSQPGSYIAAFYNPFLEVAAAWDLGNGFSFTNYVGTYFPVDNVLGQNYWVFNERNAITYQANGWMLTAYTVTGLSGNNPQGLKTQPNYFNYEISATKTIGQFMVGGGVFGSTDISGTSTPNYKRQSQFALAAIGGYNFTGFTVQFFVTHDVANSNYVGSNGNEVYETRLFSRLIVPLWVAQTKPSTVVAAKY